MNRKLILLIYIISYCLTGTTQTIQPINITNQSLNIPGTLGVLAWANDHPNQSYDYPKLYYAFAQGDEIVINFNTTNKKGTQRISVTEYNSKSTIYSNNEFQTLTDIKFSVPKTAIYQIEVATNHIFDRQCQINLKRIPISDKTINFNYNIVWKENCDTTFTYTEEKVFKEEKIEVVSIQTPINYYINSATNLGGRTRISFPINIPENTVEWYYTFAATRNKEDMAKTKKEMKLLANLTKVIDKTGSLSFAINALTEPPGSNYCDVYLLSEDNQAPFLKKEAFTYIKEASRVNLMSGIVRVKDCCNNGNYIIGIRNPDNYYGVEVTIEIVAVKKYNIYETRTVKNVSSIKKSRIPILDN